MKTPAPPPDYERLWTDMSINPSRVVKIITADAADASTRDYLPWDRLRYKQPPEGLTHEEWWLATKMARRNLQRPLPLRAKDGRPFTYALPDRLLQALESISRNTSGRISISEQVTNPSTRDRYVVSSLIEEAITSSQLEGAVTSRRVAKEMLRTGREPRDRSERMVLGSFQAMRRITEVRDEPLTPELVCEVHRIVTDGTLDDPGSAGRIQTDDDERIAVYGDQDQQILHIPPPASELPDRLEALCRFANAESEESYIPPVLRAVAIHFMLGYDHYFEDGNGRTARAFFYWSMLRQGYWLAEFLTISTILKNAPAQYARSFLLTEQDDGDLTHFFLYHVEVIERAIRELHDYLARKAFELRAIQRSMATAGRFNHRQLALLENAVGSPDALFTMGSHARSHRVSHETARRDLMDLEAQGFLDKTKAGRRLAWVGVPGLAERIRVQEERQPR